MNISSPYLDTIISLALIYALLSILVSILLEIWNQFIKARGKTLQDSIFKLLNDPLNHNFGYLLYQHPIINRMRKDENSYPAYISAENFTNAFIDILSQQSIKTEYVLENNVYVIKSRPLKSLENRLIQGVQNMNASEFRDMIQNFIDRNTSESVLNLSNLKAELGRWYDDYMDRIGGQYKTNNRSKMIGLGLAVAIFLNVDTFHLTKVFFLNQELRNRMVVEAQKVASDYESAPGNQEEKIDLVLKNIHLSADSPMVNQKIFVQIDSFLNKQSKINLDSASKVRKDAVFKALSRWDIPMGYNSDDAPLSWFKKKSEKKATLHDYRNTAQENVLIEYFESRNAGSILGFFKWLLGIIISGIALGYGAPFWFETLVKLINIRNAGQKPTKMNQSK
jgi:hypothetical protein